MSKNLQDYHYDYPEELVAQQPLAKRHASKMMVVSAQKEIVHSHFTNFANFLNKEDIVIVNNTQVIPSRLFAKKNTGGLVEVFLLKKLHGQVWQCLLSPTRGLREGLEIPIYSRSQDDTQDIKIKIKSLEFNNFQVSFASAEEEKEALEKFGEMPLPPYIKRQITSENLFPEDKMRYQTLFAKQAGAVAAPTAGLHFSDQIKQEVTQKGIPVCELTLHVGAGTFSPIKNNEIAKHQMHEEYYDITEKTLEAIQSCRQRGGRIVAIGTTTLRALESYGLSGEEQGWTSLFIQPGFAFKYTDVLLTNFHQPKSSLLVLVSAFMGRERILNAYQEAIAHQYRLFSYGDCMLLAP